jgi:uncharacterized protein (TIGR03435 family)
MILEYLSVMWTPIAPALGNHLWQSTLFAVTAGLLTLTLRKNHARFRYWLWLAASVKFLIPFSLLVGIGRHLTWSSGSAGTKAGLYFAIEEIGRPFAQPTMPVIFRATPSTVSPSLIHLLPTLLLAVWLCGFLVVLFVWCVRWRRISAAIRQAAPLREGREVEELRRLQLMTGIRNRIEMRLSRASLEPGIFGIAQPILVWPAGISEHLEDAHLQAILTHEVWHVRRRDNLTAAIHMVVEGIFWFHPLVWWMGARLVEERERACDEEVLDLGSERQVYAESILKICEFCVGSPLACVSGVTGADLRNRIVRIMTQRVALRLNFHKKLLLGVAGITAVAMPLTFGLLHAQQTRVESQAAGPAIISTPQFEVASIKPDKSGDGQHVMMRMINSPNDGRFYATNVTLKLLLRTAYGVQDSQISGGPSWTNSERYDIEAKSDGSVDSELRRMSPDQGKLMKERMLQALLADRFHLMLRHETRNLPIYALVVTKNGPKLQSSRNDDEIKGPDGMRGPGAIFRMTAGGQMTFQGASMPMLAQFLSQQLNRTVMDKTDLKGIYDFTLQWAPDESEVAMPNGTGNSPQAPDIAPAPDSSGSSIFTSLQEQLGLKLESQKAPVDTVTIDHIERPSQN